MNLLQGVDVVAIFCLSWLFQKTRRCDGIALPTTCEYVYHGNESQRQEVDNTLQQTRRVKKACDALYTSNVNAKTTIMLELLPFLINRLESARS